MARSIRPEDLGTVIEQELTIYSHRVLDALDKAASKAVKEIAKKTKATAPRRTGSYKKNISSKQVRKTPTVAVYAWYVKAPDYRLTHLLAHGHATKNGGRTRPDPFLKNAVAEVLPQYERDVEEAIKNG